MATDRECRHKKKQRDASHTNLLATKSIRIKAQTKTDRLYAVLCFVAIGAVQLSKCCCANYEARRKHRQTLTLHYKRFWPQSHTHRGTNKAQVCTPKQRAVTGCTPILVLSRLVRYCSQRDVVKLLRNPSRGGIISTHWYLNR